MEDDVPSVKPSNIPFESVLLQERIGILKDICHGLTQKTYCEGVRKMR